jgi:hypothetical protein
MVACLFAYGDPCLKELPQEVATRSGGVHRPLGKILILNKK